MDAPETVDIFWSFRSPYSYLATPAMVRLKNDFEIELMFRPVLPLAVRDPDFFAPENIKRARYIMLDWVRRAEFLGMQRSWPDPDPVVQDFSTLTVAADQPYIGRLTRLGVEAARCGRGVEFAYEVSHLLFGSTRNWDQGDHLARAVERAGLSLAAMETTLYKNDHDEEIVCNQEALQACGHWGVPTFVFRGEPFFGEDRIETLRWRLEQQGVARKG